MYCGWWFDSMEKFFISHPVESRNSYCIWIHIYKEFSMNSYIFCTLNIRIHTNMNSYFVWIHILFAVIMYEFIYFCSMNSYYVRIHLLFAVIMYEFIYFWQCKIKAVSAREPRACSASREGEARAHLLPQPGRARLPRPLGLRAAASIVRVACGCPDS
jgi:hypothetical protein